MWLGRCEGEMEFRLKRAALEVCFLLLLPPPKEWPVRREERTAKPASLEPPDGTACECCDVPECLSPAGRRSFVRSCICGVASLLRNTRSPPVTPRVRPRAPPDVYSCTVWWRNYQLSLPLLFRCLSRLVLVPVPVPVPVPACTFHCLTLLDPRNRIPRNRTW